MLENMIAYVIHYTSIPLQVFSCSLNVHFQLMHILYYVTNSQLLQLNDGGLKQFCHSHSVITEFCEGQAQTKQV